MKKCSHCQIPQDDSQFPANKKTKDGLASWCKTCRRNDGNPQRKLLQYDLQAYKQTHGCQVCGERDPRVLQFHHPDPSKKKFNIGEVGNKKPAEIWDEVAVCLVVCTTCHQIIHRKRRYLSTI